MLGQTEVRLGKGLWVENLQASRLCLWLGHIGLSKLGVMVGKMKATPALVRLGAGGGYDR